MRICPLIALGVLIPSSSLAVSEERSGSSVAKESLTKIKESFPFKPSAIETKEQPLRLTEEIVVMEPFIVIGSHPQRDLAEAIERFSQKVTDERFSITKGGSVFERDTGKLRIEVGALPGGSGLTILRLSW